MLKGQRHEIIYPFWSKHSDLATQKQTKIGLMNCFHFLDNTYLITKLDFCELFAKSKIKVLTLKRVQNLVTLSISGSSEYCNDCAYSTFILIIFEWIMFLSPSFKGKILNPIIIFMSKVFNSKIQYSFFKQYNHIFSILFRKNNHFVWSSRQKECLP